MLALEIGYIKVLPGTITAVIVFVRLFAMIDIKDIPGVSTVLLVRRAVAELV